MVLIEEIDPSLQFVTTVTAMFKTGAKISKFSLIWKKFLDIEYHNTSDSQ